MLEGERKAWREEEEEGTKTAKPLEVIRGPGRRVRICGVVIQQCSSHENIASLEESLNSRIGGRHYSETLLKSWSTHVYGAVIISRSLSLAKDLRGTDASSSSRPL